MNLVPIEYGGQRVLTTQQLAEGYGTEPQIITNNYNRNKDRYRHGVHYFALSGDEKKAFINLNQFDLGLKNAATIYLWTEKGALYHAKSLNTDRAWEVYDQLVETYFRVTKNQFSIPQTYPEALRALADEVEKREAVEAEKQKLLPKAESYDSLMSTDGLFSMSNTAKILNYQGAGPQNIFKALAVEDIFFKRGDRYSVYQEYIRRGYFQEKATTYRHGDRIEAYKQIFATPKGLDWLDRFLAERGYEKTPERRNARNAQR